MPTTDATITLDDITTEQRDGTGHGFGAFAELASFAGLDMSGPCVVLELRSGETVPLTVAEARDIATLLFEAANAVDDAE
jgi:hypothetical protein